MQSNGLKLRSALEVFSITSQFWAQNAKIKFLKTIRVLRAFFFQIEVQVISTPSSRLEKEHQTPEFLLMNEFLICFLKKLIFCIFLYFQK